MKKDTSRVEVLVRRAFDLLLEIRQHPEAVHLLAQVIGFLKVLVRERRTPSEPVVICVRAVHIRGG
jgi:hypothetical protein